jgi:hypothetical protein
MEERIFLAKTKRLLRRQETFAAFRPGIFAWNKQIDVGAKNKGRKNFSRKDEKIIKTSGNLCGFAPWHLCVK